MGNTLAETEPKNSMEGTTIITDVHVNCSEPSKLWIPKKRLDAVMNTVDIMDDDLSLQELPIAIATQENTPKLIKREGGIKS